MGMSKVRRSKAGKIIRRVAMTKIIGVGICVVLAICVYLSSLGCAMFQNTTDVQKAYVVGRITAATYIDTEDVQPARVNLAAQISYRVLCAVTKNGSPDALNDIINAEVAKIASATDSVVLTELVCSQVSIAQQNLAGMIDGIPSIELLRSFQAGIQDVLAEHDGERILEN